MARSKVPEAGFVRADIAHVPFADGVFDAVVAFYSIIHVPRDEHVGLMANVYHVLRPGGILVATMGASDCPDTVEKDWLGVPMFFSHYAGSANVALVQQVGFDIVSAEDEAQLEHGDPVMSPPHKYHSRCPEAPYPSSTSPSIAQAAKRPASRCRIVRGGRT